MAGRAGRTYKRDSNGRFASTGGGGKSRPAAKRVNKGTNRLTRDNSGKITSVGGNGATVRGGRLRTAAGNLRARQTTRIAGGRPGMVGKGGKVKGGSKVLPTTRLSDNSRVPAAQRPGSITNTLRGTMRALAQADAKRVREIESITGQKLKVPKGGTASAAANRVKATAAGSKSVSQTMRAGLRELARSDARMTRGLAEIARDATPKLKGGKGISARGKVRPAADKPKSASKVVGKIDPGKAAARAAAPGKPKLTMEQRKARLLQVHGKAIEQDLARRKGISTRKVRDILDAGSPAVVVKNVKSWVGKNRASTMTPKAKAAPRASSGPKSGRQIQYENMLSVNRQQLSKVNRQIKSAGPNASGLRLEKMKLQNRMSRQRAVIRAEAGEAAGLVNKRPAAIKRKARPADRPLAGVKENPISDYVAGVRAARANLKNPNPRYDSNENYAYQYKLSRNALSKRIRRERGMRAGLEPRPSFMITATQSKKAKRR